MGLKKLVVIGTCYECPNFDYVYYDYAAECTVLGNRRIDKGVIPPDCPLEDAPEGKELTLPEKEEDDE